MPLIDKLALPLTAQQRGTYTRVVDAQGRSILLLDCFGEHPYDDGQCLALGKLFAASPALLAACQEAYRVLALVQGMVVINRDPGTQECLDQLDAAIRAANS